VFGGDKTKVEQAKKAADDHWQRATKAMAAVSSTLDKAQPVKPKTLARDVARVTGQARTGVDKARGELKAAAAAIEPLRASKMKTAYTSAVSEADAALADLDRMLAYIEHIGRLYEFSLKGSAQVHDATLNLDRAISAANQNNYAACGRFATRASNSLTAGAALFSSGDKTDRSAGFAKAVAYATKLKEEAALLVELADAGSKKQLPRYNALAARQRVVQQAVASMVQPEVIATTNWAALGLKRYQDSIQLHLDRGQALFDSAQKAFVAGSY
jgi:hypothetical protein